jgi:ABC-type lipoprotein release transport system permease subunit
VLGLHDFGKSKDAYVWLSSYLYARFSLPDTVSLSIAGLVITLLAALYPAWFASRLEPIEALRAL